MRDDLIALFYENNVVCDQKIEGLADDVADIVLAFKDKAIRHFAEQLKVKFDQYCVGYEPYALVDDVLKEMGAM